MSSTGKQGSEVKDWTKTDKSKKFTFLGIDNNMRFKNNTECCSSM